MRVDIERKQLNKTRKRRSVNKLVESALWTKQGIKLWAKKYGLVNQ
jgi:hypothetical protein